MNSSFARHLGCALGITLLCLGTAASARQQEAQRLRLQTPARDISVQIAPDFVMGSDVRLVRDETAVRGRASGRSVFVRLGEDELEGLVGSQPARLSWLEQEGTLRLEGTLSGGPVGLELGPERLTGTAGPCTYDLEYQDEAYVGVRVCGTGGRQPVSVVLPPGLLEQVSPMEALALTLVLGM